MHLRIELHFHTNTHSLTYLFVCLFNLLSLPLNLSKHLSKHFNSPMLILGELCVVRILRVVDKKVLHKNSS